MSTIRTHDDTWDIHDQRRHHRGNGCRRAAVETERHDALVRDPYAR